MRTALIAAVAAAGLLATASPIFAQGATVAPGAAGTEPLAPTGAGRDSAITGYSQSGRGGTGGAGGILSNGTSDGAGTATGGNSGGKPSNGGSGG